MSLKDIEIAVLVERYARERDRFEKMATKVATNLSGRLRGSAIPHLPTFRAKDPESFRQNLTRDRHKYDLANFEREFAPAILDLAGVRVLLYRPQDIEPTCAAVEDLFELPADARFRKNFLNPEKYQARHRVVKLRQDHLSGDPTLSNLLAVYCEVQIVTLGDHIWNELEHDIVYKTPAGVPSTEQQGLLKALRGQLNAVRDTVDLLMEATERQQTTSLAVIETPEDLRHALKTRCGRTLHGDLERLLDLLAGILRDVTRAELDRLPIGASELDSTLARLAAKGIPIPADDVRIVAAALWALYGKDFSEIVDRWPGRRGPLSRFIHTLDTAADGPII